MRAAKKDNGDIVWAAPDARGKEGFNYAQRKHWAARYARGKD